MSDFPRVTTRVAGEGARVVVEVLERLMRRALVRRGVSDEHAGWVAEGLAEASLRGIDTHGVRLFPTYLAELDGGRAVARPRTASRPPERTMRSTVARSGATAAM